MVTGKLQVVAVYLHGKNTRRPLCKGFVDPRAGLDPVQKTGIVPLPQIKPSSFKSPAL